MKPIKPLQPFLKKSVDGKNEKIKSYEERLVLREAKEGTHLSPYMLLEEHSAYLRDVLELIRLLIVDKIKFLDSKQDKSDAFFSIYPEIQALFTDQVDVPSSQDETSDVRREIDGRIK